MGKTKRDQLHPWNILTFDPQKTDVDEHIDLINTLGDMLAQKDEAKMEKFIDTMPTIIQTHLITCENWPATTKKAKSEHIIRKCDPQAAALPTLTSMDMVTVGLIIKVLTTTIIISIMIMTNLSNMAHHAHYVVVTITPPNIVLRENMTLTI